MRKAFAVTVIITVLLLAGIFARGAKNPRPSAAVDTDTKVIELIAKQYDFAPEEIHVKKGARVQLKVRAADRSHGLKMSLYPDGADQSGPPGLKIDPPQVNWKIEKDEERIIEFVAERAGTYGFKCSIFCGLGHGGMRGKLVVEE